MVESILGLLENGQANVRTAAVVAAGELLVVPAVELVRHLLSTDVDVGVRDAAERTLEFLEP